MTEKVNAAIYPGCHGTTFGGNPFIAYVAGAVFETLRQERFLSNVQESGRVLGDALQALAKEVGGQARGIGLMCALELPNPTADLIPKLRERGLLICTAGTHTLRLLPPLTISREELHAGIDVLKECLAAPAIQRDKK